MVQEVCKIVDTVPDRDMQLKTIESIRTVTEGKIYVEVERARITYKLALMWEKEGKVTEAAEVLQDLQACLSFARLKFQQVIEVSYQGFL